MARLIGLFLVLAAAFSGYWFFATRVLTQAIEGAAADARTSGWQVSYDTVATTGFPGTFDLNIAAADIRASDRKWRWQAPQFQLNAPAIHPTRLRATFPDTQTLQVGPQTLSIQSDLFTVEASTRMNAALSFDRAALDLENGRFVSDLGWDAGIARVTALITQNPTADRSYDIDFKGQDVTLPAAMFDQLAPDLDVADRIDNVTFDGMVTLDRALDRFVIDTGTEPVLERIDLISFKITWGDITILATGDVDIDAEGVPEGRLTITTAQWSETLDLLVGADIIDERFAPTLTNIARGSVDSDGLLTLPLTMRDGFMTMGILPLGPVPRLH